jgi:hypothetical protein
MNIDINPVQQAGNAFVHQIAQSPNRPIVKSSNRQIAQSKKPVP